MVLVFETIFAMVAAFLGTAEISFARSGEPVEAGNHIARAVAVACLVGFVLLEFHRR